MELPTIKRNNQFIRAYKKGKCLNHPNLVVYVFKKKYGPTQIGITASKKIGNAVTRNRARRVIRHGLAEVLQKDAGPYDIVIVAKHKTPYIKSWQAGQALKIQLEKAGVIPKKQKEIVKSGQETVQQKKRETV